MSNFRALPVCFLITFLSTAANAQAKKEVLGTFEIGCKVFNYNFTKNANGLYSFRVEYAETETLIYAGEKEALASVKKNLATAIKTITDTLGANTKDDDEQQKAKDKIIKDSLSVIQKILETYISDVENEENTINNIYNKRGDLKAALASAKNLDVNKAWPSGKNIVTLDSFFTLVKNAIANAVSIAETKTYPMSNFEEDPFKMIVEKILTDRKATYAPECTGSINELIKKKATALFFDIKARLDFQDDEPSTAYLKLKSNFIKCYLDNRRRIRYHASQDKNNRRLQNKLLVENVSVEFEDGTIKNILADLSLVDNTGNPVTGYSIHFKNISPISISTKTDPDSFEKIKIFASEENHVNKKYTLLNAEPQTKGSRVFLLEAKNQDTEKKIADSSHLLEKDILYFYLSDLLDYSIIAENDREDYSPANIVVKLNKQNSSAELKKEKRSKILTVRAFTDFMGIQNDEPNGLIQIEASKKINFNTARYGGAFAYSGIFSYVEPILTFSKIEKNKNSLELNASNLDQTQLQNGNKSFILRPINLYRFQKSSFDVNLNLWKINFPELKSNLQINTSIGILKTNVVDTIAVSGANTTTKTPDPNFTVLNTLRWGFTAIWEIKLESRYGVNFGWDRRKLNILSPGFAIPSNDTSNVKLLNTAFVDAFLKTNDDSKIFFRYRFTFEDKTAKSNFAQIQLGYLMDLFKTRK